MAPERPAIERRILAACDAAPPRIPVLVGGCGSGHTSLLQRVAARAERNRSQYIDAERAASTPEEFWAAVAAASPHVAPRATDRPRAGGSTRAAFDNLLAFFEHARAQDGGTPTFLIDGLLELRTFESFPGLRGALRETVAALTRSPNRFVLATRYANRARRLLGGAGKRIEIIDVPPLSAAETAATLVRLGAAGDRRDHAELARLLWLEDVDLVQVEQKRYGFRDPLLRLWVRLHSRPAPPDRADLLREAQEYAVSRLPFMEDAPPADPPAPARPPAGSERGWSLIEID